MLGVLVLVGIIVVILFFTGTGRAGSQGAITAHHCLDERRTGVCGYVFVCVCVC